jgi:hypothetical protein
MPWLRTRVKQARPALTIDCKTAKQGRKKIERTRALPSKGEDWCGFAPHAGSDRLYRYEPPPERRIGEGHSDDCDCSLDHIIYYSTAAHFYVTTSDESNRNSLRERSGARSWAADHGEWQRLPGGLLGVCEPAAELPECVSGDLQHSICHRRSRHRNVAGIQWPDPIGIWLQCNVDYQHYRADGGSRAFAHYCTVCATRLDNDIGIYLPTEGSLSKHALHAVRGSGHDSDPGEHPDRAVPGRRLWTDRFTLRCFV